TRSALRVGTGAVPTAAALPGPDSDAGSVAYAIESAGLLVTGVFGDDDAHEVSAALRSARLTADARPRPLPEPPRPQQHSADRPAAAAVPVQPGDFTGLGFDACAAPSAAAMNTWWAESPYRVLGIYISGAQRACAQPNLTTAWVADRTATGWKFLPIH